MKIKDTNKVAITRSGDAFLIIKGKPTLRNNVFKAKLRQIGQFPAFAKQGEIDVVVFARAERCASASKAESSDVLGDRLGPYLHRWPPYHQAGSDGCSCWIGRLINIPAHPDLLIPQIPATEWCEAWLVPDWWGFFKLGDRSTSCSAKCKTSLEDLEGVL
jgi:hypothetical protein